MGELDGLSGSRLLIMGGLGDERRISLVDLAPSLDFYRELGSDCYWGPDG